MPNAKNKNCWLLKDPDPTNRQQRIIKNDDFVKNDGLWWPYPRPINTHLRKDQQVYALFPIKRSLEQWTTVFYRAVLREAYKNDKPTLKLKFEDEFSVISVPVEKILLFRSTHGNSGIG